MSLKELNEIKFSNGEGLDRVDLHGITPALSFLKLIEDHILDTEIDPIQHYHLTKASIEILEGVRECMGRMYNEVLAQKRKS